MIVPAEKLHFYRLCGRPIHIFFFVYFFGGLECVGHSFAYVAHLWFLRDVWIRTQSTAVASWRATDLATHPYLSHPSLTYISSKVLGSDWRVLPLPSSFTSHHWWSIPCKIAKNCEEFRKMRCWITGQNLAEFQTLPCAGHAPLRYCKMTRGCEWYQLIDL